MLILLLYISLRIRIFLQGYVEDWLLYPAKGLCPELNCDCLLLMKWNGILYS